MIFNRHPKLVSSVTGTIIFLITSVGDPSFAASPAPTPRLPKASCRIEVDDAHISTSILRHRRVLEIKINAKSICNVRQEHVTLTLEIYKVGRVSNYLIKHVETNPALPTSSGLLVRIQDATITCANSTPSSYFGIAYSRAYIQGKWQFAGRTRSVHNAMLACGN